MDEKQQPFLTSPMAVLIGSFIIAGAILISGGVLPVKFETKGVKSATVTPTPSTVTTPAPEAQVSLTQVKDSFNKALIKFGNSNNKLVALEISDPSCPYCQAAAGQNPQLNKQMGPKFTLVSDGGSYVAPVTEIEKLVNTGKASFAWIYFPGHGAGEMGTKAMYCAFEKGKFWEVHNLIMSNKGYDLLNNNVRNDKNKSGELADFLSSVIDPATMKSCLDSGKYDNQLQIDQGVAAGLNVQGTPSFYLNATNFPGAVSFASMQSTVDSFLK